MGTVSTLKLNKQVNKQYRMGKLNNHEPLEVELGNVRDLRRSYTERFV